MKIPLFDLDKTLLQSGNKAHYDGFAYAFQSIYGVQASITDIPHDGMIDNQIMVEILKFHSIDEDDIYAKLKEAEKAKTKFFLEHMDTYRSVSLPGSIELLSRLKRHAAVIGILSGNLEQIGWKRLEQVQLRHFIDFGAFGGMAKTRVGLIEIAFKMVREISEGKYKRKDFVIVGDSVRDIETAKEGNLQSIGVATGGYSQKELTKAGADLVVSTLTEYENIMEFLL